MAEENLQQLLVEAQREEARTSGKNRLLRDELTALRSRTPEKIVGFIATDSDTQEPLDPGAIKAAHLYMRWDGGVVVIEPYIKKSGDKSTALIREKKLPKGLEIE